MSRMDEAMKLYDKLIYIDDMSDVSIFLITDDGDYIDMNDFDYQDLSDFRFIMLTNEVLNHEYEDDDTITISLKWKEYVDGEHLSDEIREQRPEQHLLAIHYTPFYIGQVLCVENIELNYCYTDSIIAQLDLSGHQNTIDIINKAKGLMRDFNQRPIDSYGHVENLNLYIPAVMAAYNATEKFNNKTIYGYLPSIGQLLIISNNIEKINNIFTNIGIDTFDCIDSKDNQRKLLKNWLWSSTEYKGMYGGSGAFVIEHGEISVNQRTDLGHYTLPLFKL